MSWYDPGEPILSPGKQIESKYPGMKIPVLPARAVVFCLGKGMPVLKDPMSVSSMEAMRRRRLPAPLKRFTSLV